MRELKFRAWDSKNKTMLNWERFSLGYAMFWLNDPKTTGLIFLQWTGLFDKQGKEIYEGDIVRFEIVNEDAYVENDRYHTFKAKIEYQPGAWWFQGIDYNWTDCNWHFYNESEREVIGNIYENPELLSN